MAGGGRELQAEQLDDIWCSLRPRRRWEAPGPKVQREVLVWEIRPPASSPGTGGAVSRVASEGRELRSLSQVNGKGIHVPRAVIGMEDSPLPPRCPNWVCEITRQQVGYQGKVCTYIQSFICAQGRHGE